MTSLIISENVPVVSSDRRLGLSSVSHCSCALVLCSGLVCVVLCMHGVSYLLLFFLFTHIRGTMVVQGILDSPLVGLCLRINNSQAV